MPLVKITVPGLSAIACAVVLLWACLLGERVQLHRASEGRASVIRSMGRIQRPVIRTEQTPSIDVRRRLQRPLNG